MSFYSLIIHFSYQNYCIIMSKKTYTVTYPTFPLDHNKIILYKDKFPLFQRFSDYPQPTLLYRVA